jgi:hypothetical protein
MTGSTDAYAIGWTAVTAGTAAAIALPAAGSGTIVDSGGSEIIVPDATFQSIASALEQDANIQSMLGSTWFSSTVGDYANCVTLDETPAELDATLPPLTLTLGSSSPIQVVLTATESYLTYSYLSSSQVQYCQALIDGTATYGNLYYLGQSLMLGHVLVYDRAGNRFGIAPGVACPY